MLAYVARLRGHDHDFLSAEKVAEFNGVFGVAIKPYLAFAEPNVAKGLTFGDGRKSDMGYDACAYAEAVCHALGSTFEPWQMGRGFRLRSACDALQTLLEGGE
jgi:hypothetical protein